MESVRKTYEEKLKPTPAQERALDEVLLRCRTLYNVALGQRKTAWERCRVSVKRYAQEGELKDVREAFPEYEAIHSRVLQDVLARLDKTYQAFFIWRGTTYRVVAVLDMWHLRDGWWKPASQESGAFAGPTEDQECDRHYFRLDCWPGLLCDLYFDAACDRWILDRVYD